LVDFRHFAPLLLRLLAKYRNAARWKNRHIVMRPSPLEAIITALVLVSTSALCVASDTKSTQAAPAAKAKEPEALRSTSGMTASDYAECVSDLTSRKVVFEQLGDTSDKGCRLSGAIKLEAVVTPFGDVALSGAPTMLCSFGQQFSSWVRDVATPICDL
jgi:hypothetical protein